MGAIMDRVRAFGPERKPFKNPLNSGVSAPARAKRGWSIRGFRSSNVQGFSYDPESRMLTVTFKKGLRRYSYFRVEPAVFSRMDAAVSKGKFVHRSLKRYPYRRENRL